MKKCRKCQCVNDDEAKYCRKCGFVFSSLPWWKEFGFMPVRNFKLKNNLVFQIFSVLWLPYLVMLTGGIGNFFYHLLYDSYFDPWVLMDIIGLLFLYYGMRFFSRFCFRNYLRKRRKELLDSDFRERNSYDKRYAIFARGDKNSHKFGLFDTKRVKTVLYPKYDSLSWEDNEQMLKAIIDGKAILIDIKGNEYEM